MIKATSLAHCSDIPPILMDEFTVLLRAIRPPVYDILTQGHTPESVSLFPALQRLPTCWITHSSM